MLALQRRTLSDLPPPSADIFTLRPPWSPIAARTLTDTLCVDPGLFACWRMRGLGPEALPPEWTRGRSLVYRIDDVLSWLAGRHGEPFDQHAAWCAWLTANHLPADPAWARRLAERAGPVQGDVSFTSAGWQGYLASLS